MGSRTLSSMGMEATMADDDLSELDAVTTTYLNSEFGTMRELSMEAAAGTLLGGWAALTCHLRIEAGCDGWAALHKAHMNGTPRRVGDTWAWSNMPGVFFCSQECAMDVIQMTKILRLQTDPLTCDVCGSPDGNLYISNIGTVCVAVITCAHCAEFPEAKAKEN